MKADIGKVKQNKVKFLSLIILLFFTSNLKAKDYKILSLPAGGATCIMSACFLNHIEKQTGKKTFELFDEIWCSSGGAIIAGLSTLPNKQHKSSEEIIEFFESVFSNFAKAYLIREKVANIIGNVSLNETKIPLRILTAIQKNINTWDLFGFTKEIGNQILLKDAVAASCTVYPYLYMKPYQINTSGTELKHFIDAGCLCCENATPDPTAFFLDKFLEKLSSDDTLTVYFLSNAFMQSLDYNEIVKVLKNNKSYSIRYYDCSFDNKYRKQIEIVNIHVNINHKLFIDNYLKSLNYIKRSFIVFIRLLFTKILGQENADANLIGTGIIPIYLLKCEANKIINNSKNFLSMLDRLS